MNISEDLSHLRTYVTAEYWRDLFTTFWHAMHTAKFWKELVIVQYPYWGRCRYILRPCYEYQCVPALTGFYPDRQ